MEIWEVLGVDTQATEKNKTTGEVVAGVKYYLAGDNFDSAIDGRDRFLGRCVSVLFLSNADREKFRYDAMPGDQIRVGYNRWGRVSLFEAVF